MTIRTAALAGAAALFVSARALAPDFGVLLGGSSELKQAVDGLASQSARAAQAFGGTLSPADRRGLQQSCTALVANLNDAAAARRLQEYLSRYEDNDPAAVLRFCLDPAFRQLQSDLEASVDSLRRAGVGGGDGGAAEGTARADMALEARLREQQRRYTTISNVMKTRHDTAKNSISNVR